MLAISGFIGVYFGFIKKEGQDTVDGYLLGGKKMTLFPVAMSLIASYISGIALLGIPSEVYTYGMNYSLVLLSYPTAGLVCSYIFLPVFFKLEQVSVYQYMELRFNKSVRKKISFLFTISQIGPIVMYGPALALSQGLINSCVTKQEKIDETECIVPEVVIKEEEGQVFCYGGIIDLKQQGNLHISNAVTMISVKQEDNALVYYGAQDFLEKRPVINQNDLNLKMNMDSKRLLNVSYNSYESVSSSNIANNTVTSYIQEKPNECPHCDYKTINGTRLKRHIMARHTGEKPHQCPHCEYRTLRGNSLKIHIMSQHTGEKPLQCPHCEFRTVDPSNLKKHITARHLDEKSQQCPHCSYKTSRANTLNIHIMSQHTGEKPYQCPHCEYRTVDPSNLRKHVMVRHIGEKPQQCPYCEYKTLHPNSLNIHVMSRHTGEKPYKCSHCEFRTVDPSNLRKHIIARHIGVKTHAIFNGLCNVIP